jgi:hypothetical protein
MDMPIPALTSHDLPPLAIKESLNRLLVPSAARYSLTVIIDFLWLPGDSITITWSGTPGSGSYTSPRIPIGGFKRPFTTHIDNSLVAFNLGLTVIVYYTLYRGTEPPVNSQLLALFIPVIDQTDLPLPVIKEASDEGEGPHLDVSDRTDVTLRIRSWLLSRRGQFFWLTLSGIRRDGSVWEAAYWQAPEYVVDNNFSLGYYEQKVPAAPLQDLKNGSVLTMEFKAGLQSSPGLSDAQAFAHRNYIVRTTPPTNAPRLNSVVDPAGQEIGEGMDTSYNRATLSGAAIEEVKVFDGQTPLGTALSIQGAWQFPVTGLTKGLHVFTGQYAAGGASNSRTINVTENREVQIKEAAGSTSLNPADVTTALTSVLDYQSQPDDLLSMKWAAAPGTPAAGSYESPPVTVGNTPKELLIPLSVLAYSIGKPVEVSASYTRGGSPAVPLRPLALVVQPIPQDLLISPVVDEAKGADELDLKDIAVGVNLTFLNWIHMATGQRMTLDLTGFSASGAANNRNIWRADRNAVHRAWVTAGTYTLRLPPDYFLSLGVGTVVSILVTVRLDQNAASTAVTVFDPRRYTITDTR